jgi:hypothetical protein
MGEAQVWLVEHTLPASQSRFEVQGLGTHRLLAHKNPSAQSLSASHSRGMQAWLTQRKPSAASPWQSSGAVQAEKHSGPLWSWQTCSSAQHVNEHLSL